MSVQFLGLGISVSAPMVEEVSWCCRYVTGLISFGLWTSEKLELQVSKKQGQLPSLHIYAMVNHRNFPMETTIAQEIEKHMVVAFSVLELHIETSRHVYEAWVFHLLAMNHIPSAMQRLKIVLKSSVVKEECPIVCSCEPMNWRFQTISLTALEEVEINGFEAEDHEFYLSKLIIRCAPMLKRMTVKLSQEVPSSNNEFTEIYNIVRAYSSVECYVYLSSETFLCFANSGYLRERITRWIDDDEERTSAKGETGVQYVVLVMSAVGSIDTSRTSMLDELKKTLDRRAIQIVLANPESEIMKKLDSSKVLELIGHEWIFPTVGEAVAECDFVLHSHKPSMVVDSATRDNMV